jgi:hypothetical protein
MNNTPSYNPEINKIPIKWLNCRKSKAIKLGQNESIIKNCFTGDYPESSVVVKFHSDHCFEINFMGAAQETEWRGHFVPRRNVKIYRMSDNKFGTFDFKCFWRKTELEDYYPYINYILNQVNLL